MLEKKTPTSGLRTLPSLARIDAPLDMYFISFIPPQQSIAAGRQGGHVKNENPTMQPLLAKSIANNPILDYPVMVALEA